MSERSIRNLLGCTLMLILSLEGNAMLLLYISLLLLARITNLRIPVLGFQISLSGVPS